MEPEQDYITFFRFFADFISHILILPILPPISNLHHCNPPPKKNKFRRKIKTKQSKTKQKGKIKEFCGGRYGCWPSGSYSSPFQASGVCYTIDNGSSLGLLLEILLSCVMRSCSFESACSYPSYVPTTVHRQSGGGGVLELANSKARFWAWVVAGLVSPPVFLLC